jgi:fused signal recognition particle receptor
MSICARIYFQSMLNFFKKLISPFTKIKWSLGNKIRSLFQRPATPETFSELEQLFYEADLGASIALELTEKLQDRFRKNRDPASFIPFIKEELLKVFELDQKPSIEMGSPHVILVVGVNGSGKTTSLIKLAYHYQKEGKKVLIAAADTFRAAAVDQLQTWADRLSISLVKSKMGSDPAAVAFDALTAASARGIDVVLIDTAGRLQTKKDLMEELAKVRRIVKEKVKNGPHETLLVLDATIGQNALDQARTFHQFTPISGIILSKLDGSAKGGIAVAIQKELKIPILWVGMGEKEGDLFPFDPSSYVDALLQT